MEGRITPCGRPSVKANPLRQLFPYGVRGVDNALTSFGLQQSLGKCVGIIGINMLGPKFSCNEESGYGVRMIIFDAAMTYCLDPAQIEQIRSYSVQSLREYVRNLFIAQAKTLCWDLVGLTRQQFQHYVFAAPHRDPYLYEHLGMPLDRSLVDK